MEKVAAGSASPPIEDVCGLGVFELARLYRSGALSPVSVVQATLDRIERLGPTLNAYQTVLGDSALAAARAAELQLGAGIDLGPLHGVPVSVKDIINVRGTRTTAGSRVLLDSPPDEEDATVVRRLRSAGAILVGKTRLFEFACGAPDPEGPFGNVQNPRKLGHLPGASSTGSGAAVAAGLGVVSLGTDTAGSIRFPAALSGVVGLKPTYGLVPTRGVIPFSMHLDHVGPLGRSVFDVAAALAAIAGHDPAEPFSAVAPTSYYLPALGGDVRGLRLGIPTNPFFQFGHPIPLAIMERACNTLVGLGLAPVSSEVPGIEEAREVAEVIMYCDLQVYHQRYRERAELYGRDIRSRLERARLIAGTEYARARLAQEEIRRGWIELFERVDLLALPGNVIGAPSQEEDTVEVNGDRYPPIQVINRYARVANLTGLPALVVPVGETPEGLPVGIQLVGPPFGEARLLAVGYALEQAVGNWPARWGIEPRK